MHALSFILGICAGFVAGSFVDSPAIVAKVVAWVKSKFGGAK